MPGRSSETQGDLCLSLSLSFFLRSLSSSLFHPPPFCRFPSGFPFLSRQTGRRGRSLIDVSLSLLSREVSRGFLDSNRAP